MCTNVDKNNEFPVIFKNGSVITANVNAPAVWVCSINRMIVQCFAKFILHKQIQPFVKTVLNFERDFPQLFLKSSMEFYLHTLCFQEFDCVLGRGKTLGKIFAMSNIL